MRKELGDKILSDFPQLFATEARMPIACFGFECGDGWYDLIYNLCKELNTIIQAKGMQETMYVEQVKEKFAGLRFNMSTYTDETEALIQAAEELAAKTCEECGRPGSFRRRRGWCYRECDECYAIAEKYDMLNLGDEDETL